MTQAYCCKEGEWMKHLINIPKIEGNASRQAHADLPMGTYEREISKEGFSDRQLTFIIVIRQLDG